MLQNIRDNVQGTMAKVIIAIIIVPFAAFGIDSLFGGGPTDVATVNGEKITQGELQRAMEMRRRQVLASMGENLDYAQLEESRLRGPAMESLISQTLLVQFAENKGMRTPTALVDQAITSMPQFQQDGRFSPDQYMAVLRGEGIQPGYFKQLIATELLLGQMSSGFGESEFTSPVELELLARLIAQKRTFRYLTIATSDVEFDSEVGEADIETFYQAHITDYQLPEQVQVEYVDLKLEQFFQPVAEDALRAEYEAEVKGFQSQVARRAAHILLEVTETRSSDETKVLAERLVSRLKDGESFASLAREFSDDFGSREDGGDLGFTEGDTFPKGFESALAALEVDEVSDPVETDSGWHVIKLVEKRGDSPPSFEERREAILSRLQSQEAEPRFLAALEELRDIAFNADNLKAPAEALDVQIQQSEWISKDAATGLLADARLRSAAFSEEVKEAGHNSDVIELAPDHFVVLRVADQRPPRPVPLEEVRDELVGRILVERKHAALDEKAQQLRDAIDEGLPLEEVAKQSGLSWQIADEVTRQSLSVDPELVSAAFSMPSSAIDNDPLTVVRLASGGAAIIKLERITQGTLDDLSPAEKNALTLQLQRMQGSLVLAAFNDSVRDAASIEILAK